MKKHVRQACSELQKEASAQKKYIMWDESGDNGIIALIDWLTSGDNYARFCGGGSNDGQTKDAVSVEIAEYINSHPKSNNAQRTPQQVRCKVEKLAASVKEANDWRFFKTGVGVMQEENGPQKVTDYINKRWPFYFALEEVFFSRSNVNPPVVAEGGTVGTPYDESGPATLPDAKAIGVATGSGGMGFRTGACYLGNECRHPTLQLRHICAQCEKQVHAIGCAHEIDEKLLCFFCVEDADIPDYVREYIGGCKKRAASGDSDEACTNTNTPNSEGSTTVPGRKQPLKVGTKKSKGKPKLDDNGLDDFGATRMMLELKREELGISRSRLAMDLENDKFDRLFKKTKLVQEQMLARAKLRDFYTDEEIDEQFLKAGIIDSLSNKNNDDGDKSVV